MFSTCRVKPFLTSAQRLSISNAQVVPNISKNVPINFLQPNLYQHMPQNPSHQLNLQPVEGLNILINEKIPLSIPENFTLETPNHSSLPEPILLENISLGYLRDNIRNLARPLLDWLSTDDSGAVAHLDSDVKIFFIKASEYTASYGLLLADIHTDELINHIEGLKNFKDLFSPAYISQQKKLLYGNNAFPILINQRKSPKFLQVKRQILIEKLSHLESLNRANEDAFNIISMHKTADIKALSNMCNHWVSEMTKFISCNGVYSINPSENDTNNFVDNSKYEFVKDICETLNSTLICQISINVVLQTVCIPTYHNNTNYQVNTKKFIPKSNQTLVTNVALRIGEEIINNYSNVKGEIFQYNAETLANIGGFFLYALVKTAKIKVPLDMAVLQLKVEFDSFLSNIKMKLIKSNVKESDLNETLSIFDLNEINFNREFPNKLNALCKKYKVKFPGIPDQWIIEPIPNDFESNVYISSFTHSLERFHLKTFGIVSIRDCCWSYIKDTIAKSLLSLSYLPMVIEPKPWTSYTKGGCYSSKAVFIRTPIGSYCDYSVYDFTRIYNIVNAISRVPWKINTKMLKLIDLAWNSSSAKLNLWPHLPNKSKINLISNNLPAGDHKNLYARDSKVVEIQNAKLAMETPLLQRRLNIAKEFSNASEIFFPHNLDFRGRLYPMSSHLNHMGDDLCRSLLVFGKGKPLGERGLFWLKVQIANLFGQDKIPFQKRLDWVENNIPMFERLLNMFNPSLDDIPASLLDDEAWHFWTCADDPWQGYFAISEFLSALKHGNPEEYVSNIPIQQDGSCNGLQHYAALGRDLTGGSSVNLTPSESPQDVYSAVLQSVIEKVHNDIAISSTGDNLDDAESGDSCDPDRPGVLGKGKSDIAKLCLRIGLLKRKVVKQTVMTICYGVTRSGAEEQIKRQILELYNSQLTMDEIQMLSQYIADKILSSINKVFKEAMKIKKWLDKISLAHNSLEMPINWLSPIGLPCHQPYSKHTKTHVISPLQCLNITNPDPDYPDKQKQKLAFPPNFIHSLDATHLMMTAESLLLSCRKLEYFAAVHDSYWTLPSDVDMMNVAIREEFVRLYKQPILSNLYRFCTDRLGIMGEGFIPEPPKTGSLDINVVTESKYFFH